MGTQMSGLRLPKATQVSIGTSTVQSIEDTWSTSPEVATMLEGQGIVDVAKPAFACPEIDPNRFNAISADEIISVYLQLNAWFAYISELLSTTMMYVLEYTNMSDHLEAELRETFRDLTENGKKFTKDEIADKITTNPKHIEVTRMLQRYKQYKIRLETRAETLGKSIRMVSRHVEIRRQELELSHTNQPNTPPNWNPPRGRFGP